MKIILSIYFQGKDVEIFKFYLEFRKSIDTDLKEFLLNSRSTPLVNYSVCIETLRKTLQVPYTLPTLTDVRKFGGTLISSEKNSELSEKLAEHMTHLPTTSTRYYRSRDRYNVTHEMKKKINSVMCKL